MAMIVLQTSSAADPARKRLTAARVVLILGWFTLAVGLLSNMGTVTVGWNQKSYSTWTVISWLFRPPYWGGVLLFAPLFIGLAAGTVATLIPTRSTTFWPLWLCRVGAVGVCEGVPLGMLYLVSYFGNSQNAAGGHGIGTLFFATGSLFIGLSAWIRPVRIAVSDGEAGKPSAQPLVGTAVLAAGWVLLLFALFVPGYQPAGAPAASLRMFGILRTLFLTDCRSIFPFHFSAGLLWSFPYFFGLVAAIFWSSSTRVRASLGFTVLLRILSMGLLAPLARTAVMLANPPSGIVFYGFFAMSAASALIFIGVWRIPTRRKRGTSEGEDGEQNTTSGANPDSVKGGT